MLAEFSDAVQSVKTVYDLIKATQGLSNSTEVLMAVSEVQQKLMDANAAALASQDKQASLAERVRELEAQLRDSEDWKSQMQSYELMEFPTKALAYKLKSEMANGEPIHYLCTACVDKKKKTTLQPKQRHLHCPECKYAILTQQDPPPSNRRSNPTSWKVT